MAGGSKEPRTWVAALVAVVALLALPLAAWLALPRYTTPNPAPGASHSAAQRPATTAKPARTAEAPTPDETAAAQPKPVTTGPVRGVVLDPDANPVAGASVGCVDREGGLVTTTDGEGKFELPDDADGCSVVAHDRTHSPSEKTTVRVGDNVVRLQRGGSISGVVVDETGKGVSPFVIAIESFLPAAGEGPMPMGRARRVEDDGGNFEWTELPAGRYVLTASADGRPPSKSDSIDVEAGRSSHHVRIVLPRGGVLSGRVLDVDSRQPVLGAVVALDTATATGANLVASATTDERGAFSLSGVPPQGPFSVRVTRDGYRTKIVSGIEMRGLPTRDEVISITTRGDGGADSELAGIGAMLAAGPQGVYVAGLVGGAPAEKAGLEQGDVFLRIDGQDARTMTMPDCVQRLRGPEGSVVRVTVRREGKATREVTIVRQIVVR